MFQVCFAEISRYWASDVPINGVVRTIWLPRVLRDNLGVDRTFLSGKARAAPRRPCFAMPASMANISSISNIRNLTGHACPKTFGQLNRTGKRGGIFSLSKCIHLRNTSSSPLGCAEGCVRWAQVPACVFGMCVTRTHHPRASRPHDTLERICAGGHRGERGRSRVPSPRVVRAPV